MKKHLKEGVTLDDLWMENVALNPAEMNATSELKPTAEDANDEDAIVCLNSDGEFELAQYWWVEWHECEYPYWLPHPASQAAKSRKFVQA